MDCVRFPRNPVFNWVDISVYKQFLTNKSLLFWVIEINYVFQRNRLSSGFYKNNLGTSLDIAAFRNYKLGKTDMNSLLKNDC